MYRRGVAGNSAALRSKDLRTEARPLVNRSSFNENLIIFSQSKESFKPFLLWGLVVMMFFQGNDNKGTVHVHRRPDFSQVVKTVNMFNLFRDIIN